MDLNERLSARKWKGRKSGEGNRHMLIGVLAQLRTEQVGSLSGTRPK